MGVHPEESAILVGLTGPLNGQRWVIRNPFLIGRDNSCDVVIADRQVSRQHARFSSFKEDILLEDLGSKNGTHRNGLLINEPTVLNDGDVIQIALVQQFQYLSSDATIPLEGNIPDVHEIPQISPHNLRLDKKSRRVWIKTKEVLPPLSASQFHLLEHLYEQDGNVVTRLDLITSIWGDEQAYEVSEQALDALIRRLRDRLSNIDPEHIYIVTVRGHGLRLDNP